MKTIIDLRPVYHRKKTGYAPVSVSTFAGPAGTFRRRTETSPVQCAILAEPGVTEPKRIITLEPGALA